LQVSKAAPDQAGRDASHEFQMPDEAGCLALIEASGLFDAAWYRARYADAAASDMPPLLHYLRTGAGLGHAPSPGFDGREYSIRHQLADGANPLVHFIATGRTRSVKPADLEEVQARQILRSGYFDEGWYMARHGAAVRASGLSPVRHYLRFAREQKLSPGPKFDCAAYLASHAAAAGAPDNPLLYYLRAGRAAGHVIVPDKSPPPESATPLKLPATSAAPPDAAEAQKMALIAESGLFDEGWYAATYPEAAASGLPPVLHYLRHGGLKGLAPSPAFDAAYYLAQYKDVAANRVNPLLHYINHGRHEKRSYRRLPAAAAMREAAALGAMAQARRRARAAAGLAPLTLAGIDAMSQAEKVAAISGSPYFDAAWYCAKYPDAARSGIDPAEHYLQSPAADMRQPSLLFDPQYYTVEQSPEIQESGTNPLLHYVLIGEELGRKPRALFDFTPSPGMERPLSDSDWPLAAPAAPQLHAGAAWRRFADARSSPGEPVLCIAGLAVSSGLAAEGLEPHLRRASAFAMLLGIDPATAVEAGPLSGSAELDGLAILGPELAGGRHRLADLWFSAGSTLRLRFGDGNPDMMDDAVLRVFGARDGEPATPALLAEALLPGDAIAFVDLRLANPLLPVFMVLSTTGGDTIDTAVLPFPSLCRGGLHHAELSDSTASPDPLAALAGLSLRAVAGLAEGRKADKGFLVAEIAARLTGATGAEPLFQPAMRQWLSAGFGLTLAPAETDPPDEAGEAWLHGLLAAGQRASARQGCARLVLPPDAVPTIAGLTALAPDGPATSGLVSYFVADATSFRPRLSVTLPACGAELLALQPGGMPHVFPLLEPLAGAAGATPLAPRLHAAIRLPRDYSANRSLALMPKAPDAAGPVLTAAPGRFNIDAYVRVHSAANLRRLLESLSFQEGAVIRAVTAEIAGATADAAEIGAVLERLVPGRATLHIRRRPAPLGPLLCRPDGERSPLTLIATDSVVLPDRRTLATLARLLAGNTVASASCMALRETLSKRGPLLKFETGGLFPSHLSLTASPRLILAEPDLREALGSATYPVLANGPGFLLTDTAALVTYGADSDSPDGLGFALRAAAAGLRHYCTGAVRAVFTGEDSPITAGDPPGLEAIEPARWAELLASTTIVREIA
jgi:hypothetical protein